MPSTTIDELKTEIFTLTERRLIERYNTLRAAYIMAADKKNEYSFWNKHFSKKASWKQLKIKLKELRIYIDIILEDMIRRKMDISIYLMHPL
ncbi:hypothetical protein LCGC14_0175310 [marine sediment metagenome]|uniref:Uncharacterized protein n=1 Tax=marine sediment metagenome TaxID=412755 RepID=A0A0F9V7G3_9ZZZZ